MQYIHLILRVYGTRGIKSNTFPLCVFCMPSAQGLVLSLLMGAVFGGITLYLYRTENGAFYFGALLSVLMLAVILLAIDVPYLLYTGELGVPASFLIPASGIAFVAAAFVILTIRYRCFKVRIETAGGTVRR